MRKKIIYVMIVVVILFVSVKLIIKNPADNDSCLLYFSYDNIIVRIENNMKPQIFSAAREESGSECMNRITCTAEDKNTKDIYYMTDTQKDRKSVV